jgi:hypothetical protein
MRPVRVVLQSFRLNGHTFNELISSRASRAFGNHSSLLSVTGLALIELSLVWSTMD